MVKAYLRYEFGGAFGVISSGPAPCYDSSGKLLITAALENLAVWNVKQGSLVATLVPGPSTSGGTSTSSSHVAAAEVTCITRAPGNSPLVAAGYSNGSIRIWDITSHECVVTLKGHKSGVTALRFSASGALLGSGARDTDIIVWDVVGETGLFRLRGHKDQVTDLAFVSAACATGLAAAGWLVSGSKDALVKVWDLDTQHCCQTLTGHKAEVWALDVDPSQTRLVTGSTDHELRVYAIDAAAAAAVTPAPSAAPSGDAAGPSGRVPLLRPMGSVKRQAGGHDRVAGLRFSGEGGLLACQGAGKSMELFRVRGEEEARKKLKRRKKRQREKALKKAAAAAQGGGSDSEGEHEDAEDTVRATDELEPHLVVAMKHKIRSFAFAPPAGAGATGGAKRPRASAPQLALCLANNCVEVVQVEGGLSEGSGPASYSNLQRLELGGHRSDVRTCALSAEGTLLATASNTQLKVWNPLSGTCMATMDSGYGLCCLFAPGSRHVVLGTKEGSLEVFDLGAAERVYADTSAHEGAVWSIAALPDNTGFVTGSADKTVKFWQWSVTVASAVAGPGQQQQQRQLRLAHVRTLRMADDVLCCRISPDGRLLAVALLDATIKVFFTDSLKFFLSLYGHKLPVLSLDISSDSTLLVSGSADKNIKVWGLDFGDCHRSLFAHGDAVMGVHFVPKTHYVFTVGKDKLLKYWDVDRSEQLLELAGHHGEVWCCAVSSYGDLVITGSHDRSLRRWQRSSEPFFVEEEKEARLESMFEADLEAGGGGQQSGPESALAGPLGRVAAKEGEEGSAAPAGRKTLESVSAADALVDALEMAAHEEERHREHQQQLAAGEKAGSGAAPSLAPNPMMLGLSGSAYVLRALSSVRASDLEPALLMLPFTDALRLLGYLSTWLEQGNAIELTTRVAVLLLRLHHSQLVATAAARPLLLKLHKRLHPAVQGLKDVLGVNMAALQFLQRAASERSGLTTEQRLLAARRALAG